MTMRHFAICTALSAAWLAAGCSSEGGHETNDGELGSLGLPMKTTASSGTEYRLRHADFEITGFPSNCWEDCEYYTEVVSSEDYLEQDSILLDLAEGDYEVRLANGWQLERLDPDGSAEVVDAVLLNGNYQWVWVSPHSTRWVSFQFGVGDSEIWLNGQVNIQFDVYEDPDQYWGGEAGYGGGIGTGGTYPIQATGGYSAGGAGSRLD